MQYYKRMSDVYVRQKKYQEALQSYTLYKAWSDSAFNVNETKKQIFNIYLKVNNNSILV